MRARLELVVQGNRIALAECVNRGADASERETGRTRNELPGRERFLQARRNDPVGDEDNSGNDHRGGQKERYRTKTVAKLRTIAIEE